MITKRIFGVLPEGETVTAFRLTGGEGAYVDILDYGATIQSLVVPDGQGRPVDVVLGYDTPGEYAANDKFLGATVGRHANRIGGAAFTLNGVTYSLEANNGPNHLHGGPQGFDSRMFTPEVEGDTLKMHLISPEGDQGYPGALKLTVVFRFSAENCLTIRYLATTTRDTVVNLTNHSYFDLSGGKAPMGQLLRLDADSYTENDENTLPTGVIAPVAGTPFDFRSPKAVGKELHGDHDQLKKCGGYDHNFVLNHAGSYRVFGWLASPDTGITMEAGTDLPGVQLYSGNFLSGSGKGISHAPNAALCLETQFFPNGMAIPHFEKPILRAGEQYDHVTTYRFSTYER